MPPLSWTAKEFRYRKKGADWYWALGIIALAGAAAALIFNNLLLAILILVATAVLAVYANERPKDVSFEISERGIRIDDLFYPYQVLRSFWISDDGERPVLLLESRKHLSPLIIVPIDQVHPDDVHDFLSQKLPLIEHEQPILVRVFERLGF